MGGPQHCLPYIPPWSPNKQKQYELDSKLPKGESVGIYIGNYFGITIGNMKGDTRSLD